MHSNDSLEDKFSLIKEMLSCQREAIYIESQYIMKVEILDVVKKYPFIEIGLGVSDCYELTPFFRDSKNVCDQNLNPKFFILSGLEECIFLRENQIRFKYLNARLLLGKELVKKFLNRTLHPSDL